MTYTQTYTYTLPSRAVIYIENEESNARGARDVSAEDRERGLPFENVIKPIGEAAELVFDAVKSKLIHSDKITLEFGATLKGGVNLFIASANSDATFKVSLVWERK